MMSDAELTNEECVHRTEAESPKVVLNCYDFFDRVFPESGLYDLTEGKYYGDRSLSYEKAQANQIDWLLDQIGCREGSRILDIGCGNGTLLDAAEKRGAEAIGVTISAPQVRRCKARRLDVRLLNYRNIGEDWNGLFDGIVANGSMEHFAQPSEVKAGRGDAIYQELFEICHRLIDPKSHSRRFATTVIHRHENSPDVSPDEMLKGPLSFRPFSAKFHYAALQRGFGGYYPTLDQLERCATPRFKKTFEEDGTQDYHWTSEECFRLARRSMLRWKTGCRIWPRLLSFVAVHPIHGPGMCFCLFVYKSWQWQFRGVNPPVRLLRQVWEYCD